MPFGVLCSRIRRARFFACDPVLVGGWWGWAGCHLAGNIAPSFGSKRLARIVGRVLLPDILLVHCLDDFLLIHHDKRYLRDHTGNAVLALGREGFIVSPKSVLEPATQLVFLGKWLDLLVRMVWSHEVAHLQMLVTCLRLAVWRSQKRLMQSFLGFLHWHVGPRGVACPFAAGAYCWLREGGGGGHSGGGP